MSSRSCPVEPSRYANLIDFKRFVEAYYSRGKKVYFNDLKGIWRYDYQLKGFLDLY